MLGAGGIFDRRLKVDGAEQMDESLKAWRSKTGRIPPHPAVFVRVANKGVRAYGTWKSIRNFVETNGVGDTRQFA
jgi:hypothetical protein